MLIHSYNPSVDLGLSTHFHRLKHESAGLDVVGWWRGGDGVVVVTGGDGVVTEVVVVTGAGG